MNRLNRLLVIYIIAGFSLPGYAQTAGYSDCNDLLRQEKYDEAFDCMDKYIKKNPKDIDAFALRAAWNASVENYKAALSDVNEAIKNHNKHTKISKDALYTIRGRIYEDVENYDEALNDYAIALKINPDNATTLIRRANLYHSLENYTASDADWKHVLKIEKDNISAAIGLARNMVEKGQIDEAIKELNRLEKIDAGNSYIYMYRAKAYEKKEDYRKAIDDVIDWIYYDEVDANNIGYLVDCAEHEFTYTIAKISEKVVKDTDKKTMWLYLRALLYSGNEMYNEAIADYNAIEQLSSTPQLFVYEYRGECYVETGEYDKAIAEFDKGLELKEDKDLYLRKAGAEYSKGDYESSIADYTKITELDPMNDRAYYNRGWVKEFGKKDYQGALHDYTTAIEIDNSNAHTYLSRGRIYQKILNQPELAKKDFLTVLKLEDKVRGNNYRQYALFFLGRIDEAIVIQDSILSEYPAAGNYYDATCLYSLMNRQAEAIEYLRIAFEKGYREFTQIENDTDLDNIKNMPEFIELLKEWKSKMKSVSTETSQPVQPIKVETKKYVVKMKPLKSGVYEIPCVVNDLPLKFIFDTGASDITISSLDAAFMLKNNYLTEYDFKSKQSYRTASGDIAEGTKIRLRKVKIGDLELNNIEASVIHKQTAPLLFGQSALGKFVNITIDNANNEIIFEY
jgi:clan AA aspartic protease (TIGR02281 family)